MKIFVSLGLTILAYCAVALLTFGDVLSPIGFMMILPDRLGAPHWKIAVAASFVVAAIALLIRPRLVLKSLYRLPLFVAIAMIFSVTSVGIYSDWLRQQKIVEFNADAVSQYSFFRSIREVPRDFQFFLHTAALKDCVPYAWSYREMDFYQLKPDTAVNVLPRQWVEQCDIKRSR